MLFDIKNDGLYSEYEGYTKGNMFPKIYDQYKNYIPKNVDFNNDKVKIMSLEFVVNELKLYMCTHPNDEEKKKILNKYENDLKSMKERKNEYVKYFNPWEGMYV